jgi:hypothetical protein
MNDYTEAVAEAAVVNDTVVNETPVSDTPVSDTPVDVSPVVEGPREVVAPAVVPTPPVDPVRSAAGRRGGERFHQLVQLGREFEREHGLAPGRQRLKQLVQLGKRYEQEHGLAVAKPRRKRRGDAWAEFLTALARVVKPAHRAAVERLAAALRTPQSPRADAA